MTNTVAILLPGTTGSTLVDSSNVEIWPTVVYDTLDNGDVNTALALLEEPALVPQQPEGWGDTSKGYGNLQAYFEQKGFASAVVSSADDLPATLAPRQLLGFAYDWREDNRTTAGVLGGILDKIDTLSAGAAYEIWLIGHSMGGLVARTLIEPLAAGTSAAPPWFAKVKALITLGTPHLGAPLALRAMLGQLPFYFPSALAGFLTKFIDMNEDDYDSTYELLPPPNQNFIQLAAAQASIFDLGPEARSSLLKHGVSAPFLAQSQTYFGTLRYDAPPSLPPYYCVYGVLPLQETTIGYAYHPLLDSWVPNTTFGGGDEVVPAESAMFAGRPVAGTHQVAANHGKLPESPDVQAYIGSIMNL